MEGTRRPNVVCVEKKQEQQALSRACCSCLEAGKCRAGGDRSPWGAGAGRLWTERVQQLLHVLEKSRQVEPVGNGVVDGHGQRHNEGIALGFVLSPCNHRRQEGPLVKDMEVYVPVAGPRQAGHVEEIGRRISGKATGVPVGLPILQKTGVKPEQIVRKRGGQLGESLVVLVKVRIAGETTSHRIRFPSPSQPYLNSSREFTTAATTQIIAG